MKKFSYLFFLTVTLITTTICSGQIIAVDNLKNNYVYPMITSPLQIVVEGVKCEELFVSTDNGKVSPGSSPGEFYYVAEFLGVANIFIHKVTEEDTLQLGTRFFRVKPWPEHFARIGTNSSGKMKANIFKAQSGIYVPLNVGDVSGTISITSYVMRIFRDNEKIAEATNLGAKFQLDCLTLQRSVKPGDIVLFDEIMMPKVGTKYEVRVNDLRIEIQ